jgi:hypothetical protein
VLPHILDQHYWAHRGRSARSALAACPWTWSPPTSSPTGSTPRSTTPARAVVPPRRADHGRTQRRRRRRRCARISWPPAAQGLLDSADVDRHQAVVASALAAATLAAQPAPPPPTLPAETLLGRSVLKALDDELSGVAAKDHVARLAQFHRVPASPGFHDAIEYVMGRARAIGLSDVHVETFPGDGTTYFGTLHGNRGWRVDGGFLEEVQPQPRRIVSYEDVRLAVADNSESADVTVELVDVGRGTERRDYDGGDGARQAGPLRRHSLRLPSSGGRGARRRGLVATTRTRSARGGATIRI